MSGDAAVVGRIGVLIVGTRGADGPGEVRVKIRGGTEHYLAWSDDPLPKGASVLVVEARGSRTVGVVAWVDNPGKDRTRGDG
ncbi:MAG: OB-fold-containig protein [Pseudonocardiaceae bacterium]